MVTLKVPPIPESYFALQPPHQIQAVIDEASFIAGRCLGVVPMQRNEALIESVFGSMPQLFPMKTVLLARNFTRYELSYCEPFWWNEDLHCGLLEYQNRWVMPMKRTK